MTKKPVAAPTLPNGKTSLMNSELSKGPSNQDFRCELKAKGHNSKFELLEYFMMQDCNIGTV